MQFAYDKGLLMRHCWPESTIKKVTFVSKNKDDEIVLRLKEEDFKDLAYTYLAYLNPRQFKRCFRCENCNSIYQRKRNAEKNKAYRDRKKNKS